jgi:hypothetical protein
LRAQKLKPVDGLADDKGNFMRVAKNGLFLTLGGLILCGVVTASHAQSPSAGATSPPSDQPNPQRIEEITRKFAAKEAEFRRARELYNYKQTVKVQTLMGNHVDGEYQMVTDVTFGRDNKRLENVVYAPPSTLERISLTKEDLDDIVHINPFVLTTEDLEKYDIKYLGHEKVDEITAYVFFVKPKQMIGDERYFEGQIWVDDQDLQIVKTRGRPVFNPTKRTKDQRFPNFETYREQIDGKYWFPTYTRADDTLEFPNADRVHIREIILYRDYKQFRSDVKITYGEQIEDKDKVKKP